MRVLDVSGPMSTPMSVKRGFAHEVMQRVDIRQEALEALMEDDAQNSGDARYGIPRRTCRFWLALRSAGGSSAPVGSRGAVGLSGAPSAVEKVKAGQPVPVGLGGAPPSAVDGSLVKSPARFEGAGFNLGAERASLSTEAAQNPVEGRTLGVPVSPLGSSEGSITTRAAPEYRNDSGGGPSGPPECASAAGDDARPRPAAARAQPPAISGLGAVTPSLSSPGLALREPVLTANDSARLFHVVVEKDNQPVVQREDVLLARAELDRTHTEL